MFSHSIEGSNYSNPCAEDFPGLYPFSEPETRAVRSLIENAETPIKIAFNYHSFGNMLIIPFNYDYANNTALRTNFSSHYKLYQEFKTEAGFPEGNIMSNGMGSIG